MTTKLSNVSAITQKIGSALPTSLGRIAALSNAVTLQN
jgi:hypothetical protein